MARPKTKTAEPELFEPAKQPAAQPAKAEKLPAKAEKPTQSRAIAHRQPAAPQAPRSMIEVIMTAALDPRCDPAKMRELYEMQKDIEDREARKSFTRAFNALQFKLPSINRDGIIDHGDGVTSRGNARLKTRYSTYPNLMSVCRPLLKEHGFTFNNVIEPSADGSKADVVGYLTHVDGHNMASRFPLSAEVSGKKNNQQGFGSGASYGKRYNLILMLDIVSEDPRDLDNDGFKRKEAQQQDHEQPDESATISAAEAEELRLTIADAQLPEDKFCEKYRIDRLVDLPAKQFAGAKKDIAAFKKRREQEAKKHG